MERKKEREREKERKKRCTDEKELNKVQVTVRFVRFLKSLCLANIKFKTALSDRERCKSIDCRKGEMRKRNKGTEGMKE